MKYFKETLKQKINNLDVHGAEIYASDLIEKKSVMDAIDKVDDDGYFLTKQAYLDLTKSKLKGGDNMINNKDGTRPKSTAEQQHDRMKYFIDGPEKDLTLLIKADDVIEILDHVLEITKIKLRINNTDMTAALIDGYCTGYKHALQKQIKDKQEMHDLLIGGAK